MIDVTPTGHWHVPWLRSLPEGWQLLSSKRLFSARKELARPDDQQLAATQAFGVIYQKEFERRVGRRVVKVTLNLEKRRHVEKGDFVISMRSFQGGLERAWVSGCIRSSYVVLRPIVSLSLEYFQYLFKSHAYIQALRATSNFIRDGQDLNFSNFSLVDLPLPPLVDQQLIARFLEWHGAMTVRLIRAKRKLITLLNEQRHSIVHRAVTRGLDPRVKPRQSGVGWLGDVPEGWRVIRARYAFTRIVGGGTPKTGIPDYWDGSIVWATPTDISKTTSLRTSRRKLTEAGLQSCGASLVPAGSIIVTCRAPVGNVALADVELATNQGCKALVPDKQLFDNKFAFYVMSVAKKELASLAVGTTFTEVSSSRLKDIFLPLPPLAEQLKISAYIADETAAVDVAIDAARHELAAIQEFRNRLITDVVTGQIDVRTVAATLPEVPAEEVESEELGQDDEDLAA